MSGIFYYKNLLNNGIIVTDDNYIILKNMEVDEEILTSVLKEDLLKQEKLERQLIDAYLWMLKLDIKKCLPEEKRKIFSQSLSTLKDESKIHKKIIEEIIVNE